MSRSADVLVENFAPAVMPRLGLGPDMFRAVNPRLIYASGSGFGRTGPDANRLALDLTIQAMSGLMSTTGEKVDDRSRRESRSPTSRPAPTCTGQS